MFNPNRSAGEWISLMWRRADMGSGIGIAGHRATTRASEDLSALSAWGRSKRAESSPPDGANCGD